MGQGKCTFRCIPCACVVFKFQLYYSLILRRRDPEQPIYASVTECKYHLIFGH